MTAVLVGLLALPAAANAAKREPRYYHGTIVVHQAPVPGPPLAGSSKARYRFDGRYKVSAKRTRAEKPFRGSSYTLLGGGPQAVAYHADLSATGSNPDTGFHTTWTGVSDWHGSGRWHKKDGPVGQLGVRGKRFAFEVHLLGHGRATIPLAVGTRETDVSTDETGTCTEKWEQSGSTTSRADECGGGTNQSLTIPTSTAVNPWELFGLILRARACPGTKTVVQLARGFCGVVRKHGRIHGSYSWLRDPPSPADYPFNPWEDQNAASDAQQNANFFYGSAGHWGELFIRTKLTVDLKPGK